MREYHNIVESERWETTDNNNNTQDEPLLFKDPIVVIEDTVNNNIEKVDFISLQSWKDNKSGVVSYTKSVTTCHKCGKRAI